ncbi:hypothetical protein GBF35_25610 [Nonomuraea phyllanthi]|uniref:hypothetical protein n=1 Tax=Nonomuraea phyllanthi TaxID=2219224 RepID=UPI0012930D54|nr:hypothetical protein [Nonomuraea phyllanthi]QFY09577.1 hypothetical protein GBF35_25610 [Nonomuraea phyllanthi]
MMSSAATAAATAARRRQRVLRKERTAQLLSDGITDPAMIGEHVGVHERTIQRYLRELEGDVDRRAIVYSSIKPRVMEHLRKYPHLRISAWQLTRVLQLPESSCKTVRNALRSLERDGLVRHEIGTRKEGDYRSCMKLILWSLLEQEAAR